MMNMDNDRFIPLTPGRGQSPAPRLGANTATPDTARPDFQPLTAAAQAAGAAESCSGDPVVALERNGERITRIRVQCSCGKLMILDCEY